MRKNNRFISFFLKPNIYLGVIFFTFLTLHPIYSKNLVLVAAADSIPTSYFGNGKNKGILVDVINEVFKRAGYSVDIKLMPWARCIEEVKVGKADGIFSVFKTKEREEFLTYTTEVLINQVQAFFVLKTSNIAFDGDLKKLSKKRIGLIIKTSYGPILDKAIAENTFENIELSPFSKSNIQKLLSKRVDIIASYQEIVLSTAKELGELGNIKKLTPPIESIPSYLAFTKKRDFTKVINDYNKTLLLMKKDGTYDKIFKKYLN